MSILYNIRSDVSNSTQIATTVQYGVLRKIKRIHLADHLSVLGIISSIASHNRSMPLTSQKNQHWPPAYYMVGQ